MSVANSPDTMTTCVHSPAGLTVYRNSCVGMGLVVVVLTYCPPLGAGKGREQCPSFPLHVPMVRVIYSFIECIPFICRYNTLPSRRTLKNSRLVSKKDDVHVCIMCLRAIMNYQVCLCF